MRDYKSVRERLNARRDRNINDIEHLSSAIKEKEERIEEVKSDLEFLESEMKAAIDEETELLNEYKELAHEIKRKKMTGCIDGKINRLFTNEDGNEIDAALEKAEQVLENEEVITQSHKVSVVLNEIRYTIRRSDINEEERARTLSRLNNQLATEYNILARLLNK